jgi:high-affinity nickel-transport protein
VTGLLTICALGFMLGVRHAADADHVVAVPTIVPSHRGVRGAALIGVLWGIGHTLTILLVGSAIILFGWVIPPRVGLSMELSVGAMLLVLGVGNIAAVLRRVRAGAIDTPRGTIAAPPHLQEGSLGRLDRTLGSRGLYLGLRPLLVGVVHGGAGSAAVALLVMATIGSSRWSVGCVLIFGVGTIVGMVLITMAIGIPMATAGERAPRLRQAIHLAAGVLSVGFGLLLAYQIGWTDGLFTGAATWTPQ